MTSPAAIWLMSSSGSSRMGRAGWVAGMGIINSFLKDEIFNTVGSDTGQFWADGAWHDFAELDPADKDTQDGPSVSIGNGWYISWDHAKYGGTYLVWRYPDGGQLTYAGSTWPGFKVRLNDIGYTSTGERIDSIIDFTSVYAWQANGLNEPGWFTPFEISRIYGPLRKEKGLLRQTVGEDI